MASAATVGERYEPFHKIRNGNVYSMLTYSHEDAVYNVTLEQSYDPSIYNFVHLDSHSQKRSVVGKITELPTYTSQYPPNLQVAESESQSEHIKSGIHAIIKSPCSRYVLIQMSKTNTVLCYSVTPEFSPKFEVFAYKLFEYEPVAAPVNNPGVAVFGFGQQGVTSGQITYTFTPSGKFIYCTYENNMIKLDSSTGKVVFTGQFDPTINKGQLIPVTDDMVCHAYTRGYNRDRDTENCVSLEFTEYRLVFQLGHVTTGGCKWLDTLKAYGDDKCLKDATFGQLFKYETKIQCILAGNKLYFTYESRVTWSVLCVPINLATCTLGQGRIVYQHPITDRDMLCPDLKYAKDDKLYGVVMNNSNFQLVCIPINSDREIKLEVLAAGHYFNLPHKELHDHSAAPHELDYIDNKPIQPQSTQSLFGKIASAFQNLITGLGAIQSNTGSGNEDINIQPFLMNT